MRAADASSATPARRAQPLEVMSVIVRMGRSLCLIQATHTDRKRSTCAGALDVRCPGPWSVTLLHGESLAIIRLYSIHEYAPTLPSCPRPEPYQADPGDRPPRSTYSCNHTAPGAARRLSFPGRAKHGANDVVRIIESLARVAVHEEEEAVEAELRQCAARSRARDRLSGSVAGGGWVRVGVPRAEQTRFVRRQEKAGLCTGTALRLVEALDSDGLAVP